MAGTDSPREPQAAMKPRDVRTPRPIRGNADFGLNNGTDKREGNEVRENEPFFPC